MLNLVKPKPGKVLCLIKVGNRWVVGENDQSRTSPAFMKRLSDGAITMTQHAEARALQLARRAGGRIKDVIVLRWTKRGKLSMAKPCAHCTEMLWKSGVKARDVRFSNWDGNIQEFREV